LAFDLLILPSVSITEDREIIPNKFLQEDFVIVIKIRYFPNYLIITLSGRLSRAWEKSRREKGSQGKDLSASVKVSLPELILGCPFFSSWALHLHTNRCDVGVYTSLTPRASFAKAEDPDLVMECKRIADYFIVIGAPIDSLLPLPSQEQLIFTNDPLKVAYTPTIIDRYPLHDHADVSLPTGLTLFCLPDGLHIANSPKPPVFFSFIQTSDNGSRLIGCCLTFYEELNATQRSQLNHSLDTNEESDVSSQAMKQIKFFIPRCLCLLSHWPFVSSFKKFLCYLYRLSLSPCSIPLERYISNFLNDVPAPPPGKVDVTYLLGPDSVIFRRPPSNEPTAWSSLPLSSLFECLSLQNILLVFSALISERQVAFISSQYSLLTTCSESILSLMFPLTWTHVYIPILPRRILGRVLSPCSLSLSLLHLRSLPDEGVLAAPLPFFVGIHSSYLPEPSEASSSSQRRNSFMGYTPSQFEGYAVFSSETVRVFLDENRLELGSLGPPPPFPEGRAKKLMADLV
jgi:hypothetical protein